MKTIIVPVYNTEPYLPQCLDSILAQTYTNLEILLIDDGSTDRCNEICDRYAARDSRIRVFHTENRGLSAARNLGLDCAKGNYIGFVDSDDWIEPDMYEVLLQKAEETGADIVECDGFREYPDKTVEGKRRELTIRDPIFALLRSEIFDGVWDKLWKRHCFEHIRFPEGRINEDVATTYKILENAGYVEVIGVIKYHYRYRESSLSHQHDLKSLTDYWLANLERYEHLKTYDDENRILLQGCVGAAARTWAYMCDCAQKERVLYKSVIKEMNDFMRKYVPLFGYREWRWSLRIGAFFPHFLNPQSFRTAWLLNSLQKHWRKTFT